MLKKVTPDYELFLANLNLETVPLPLRTQGMPFFQNIFVLDLQGNDIVEIDGIFCQNLPSLFHLDLRNNKIKTISEHIRALMNL